MLTWKAGDRFDLGGTTFRTLRPEGLAGHAHLREEEFFIFKPRELVEHHVDLVEELKPQHIFELGIDQGGSTLFFAELARPRRIVAIDRLPLRRVRRRMETYAEATDLAGIMRTFGEVDQADRGRLAEIVEEAFEGAALDLVIDDCSHLYEPTRASFNELFPRLRPGGAYVIEDWRWAHSELGSENLEGFYPDEVPLSRLLFEVVLALPSIRDLITEVSIDLRTAVIRRGEAVVDPATFEISACSTPRGQALLAPA